MYWPRDEISAVEKILSRYGARHLLGEVSLEYDADGPRGAKPELRTRLWNPGSGARLGNAGSASRTITASPSHSRLLRSIHPELLRSETPLSSSSRCNAAASQSR